MKRAAIDGINIYYAHIINMLIICRFPIDFTLDFYFDKVEEEELAKIPKHVKELILSQSSVEYEQSLFDAVLKTDNLEGVSCFAIDQSLHGKHNNRLQKFTSFLIVLTPYRQM